MTEATTHDALKMTAESSGKVRVWDPLVRNFHSSLVGAFTLAWLTAGEWQTTR